MPDHSNSTPSTLRRIKSQVFDSAFSIAQDQLKTGVQVDSTAVCSTTNLIPSLRAASTPPERPTGRHRTESGSKASSIMRQEMPWMRSSLSRKRSKYYEEAFACRDTQHTAKSRAAKDSLITVDIRLNFCLGAEQEFIIDLAFLLSEIYQRPAGCIMVLVNTDFSILLDSSSEAAYQISISALESDIGATKNKRTAGIVRSFLYESVQVPGSRGVFIFHVVREENLVKSSTVVGQDKNTQPGSRVESPTDMRKPAPKDGRSRKSSVAKPAIYSKEVVSNVQPRTPTCEDQTGEDSIEPGQKRDVAGRQKVKKRKSLMALLGF